MVKTNWARYCMEWSCAGMVHVVNYMIIHVKDSLSDSLDSHLITSTPLLWSMLYKRGDELWRAPYFQFVYSCLFRHYFHYAELLVSHHEVTVQLNGFFKRRNSMENERQSQSIENKSQWLIQSQWPRWWLGSQPAVCWITAISHYWSKTRKNEQAKN